MFISPDNCPMAGNDNNNNNEDTNLHDAANMRDMLEKMKLYLQSKPEPTKADKKRSTEMSTDLLDQSKDTFHAAAQGKTYYIELCMNGSRLTTKLRDADMKLITPDAFDAPLEAAIDNFSKMKPYDSTVLLANQMLGCARETHLHLINDWIGMFVLREAQRMFAAGDPDPVRVFALFQLLFAVKKSTEDDKEGNDEQ